MIRRSLTIITLSLAIVFASIFIAGCSSRPDANQLRQLDDLKAECAALQNNIASKEQAKASAERENAEKNARLKKCNDDQQIVKERLTK